MAVKALLNSIFSVIIFCFYQCAGKLTLSSAEVREGEALVLTCHSTEPRGTYVFYSLKNQNYEMYGVGTGSFKHCETRNVPEYIMECDFDNWIFNLTILNPVHNQIIFCNRNTGRDDIKSINKTIFVQVPVKRITLSTPSTIDVVSGNSYTFTCKTFASRPAANILWHLNTTTLAGNNTLVLGNGLKFDVTSTLTLTFTRKDQDKDVYCSSNIVGEIPLQSTKTFLNVLYISDVQIMPGNILTIVSGQKLTLISCYVESANPEVNLTYRWMKDNGYNTSLISTTQFYLIKFAKVEDSGRYSCTVSNSAGNSSGFINVNVQKKPVPPPIIQVVCKTRSAYISLTSSYLGIKGKQILQLSKVDNVFENATSELMNEKPEINIYKAMNLVPGTEYTFRIQASNIYGITFSKPEKCSTDVGAQAERRESCEIEPIIGGTTGGFIFIIILILGVITLHKVRKGWINKSNGDTTSRPHAGTYVDQTLSSEDHHYQGFSTNINKETVNKEAYEKIEERDEEVKRSEYMELTPPCLQEEQDTFKAKDTGGMYSNIK